MGLIKSIFGIIGGLFQAIAGLVGLGKKSEFYMELPNAEQPTAVPTVSPVTPRASAVEESAEIAPPAPLPVAQSPATPPTPKPVSPAPSLPSFAANYLTSPGATPASRRRPGASLSPFLAMAKQVKTQ
ncbi:MAG: hypothetical protein VKL98_08735 [Cyanobacteriota bacterium]|nr:hypothetical protein [Cyanobacteriota bacterium]